MVEVITTRIAAEHGFRTHDGAELFYRHWPALSGRVRQAVILFHRGHEHSGRLQDVVDGLDLPEIAMFAWDARGHGRSAAGSDSRVTLGTLVKDVDTFVRHVSSTYGIAIENIAIIGQSVGGVLAATWVHDYAPKIRCLVLATPAFEVKLYVPLARFALQVAHRIFGDFHVNSYIKAEALTHDQERINSYENDPLIRRPIPVRILLALYSTAERVIADAQVIQTPVQLLISGADFVVRQRPQYEFYTRLGSRDKELHAFDGFYHDTLGEKERHLPLEKVRSFLSRMFAQDPLEPSLLAADETGPTKDEFDALTGPLPLLSPNRLKFAVMKLGIRIGGLLSHGIRLGVDTGFDSGSTLDYVYRNRASGATPLGRLIDWFYLNSVGWRGIRVRKQHIEQLLARCVEDLRHRGRELRIADIAAGQARYIFEALEDGVQADSILLRDYSAENVRKGNFYIAQRGLQSLIQFEQGDAFDAASLAAISPRPTLCVISGLYELFPDNGPVRQSLAGLAYAMEPDGYLIYTNQPWHPQLEMIARTLTSHRDHKPWIMRRRTQAEMDQLVEAAGFRKLYQLTDEWGIFTVSVAQRVNA